MFENENIGLYRDDQPRIFRNLSGPEFVRKIKAVVRVFKKCVLSVTTKANLKVVKFLDIQLGRINSTYRPYRKPNDNPMYNIDINSNHPSIKKQVTKNISKRISKLSSNEEIFNNNIRTYSDTLKICGFSEKPIFILETPSDTHANDRQKC